jgi:hypothetical protein
MITVKKQIDDEMKMIWLTARRKKLMFFVSFYFENTGVLTFLFCILIDKRRKN